MLKDRSGSFARLCDVHDRSDQRAIMHTRSRSKLFDRLEDRSVVVLRPVDPRGNRPHPYWLGGERPHQFVRAGSSLNQRTLFARARIWFAPVTLTESTRCISHQCGTHARSAPLSARINAKALGPYSDPGARPSALTASNRSAAWAAAREKEVARRAAVEARRVEEEEARQEASRKTYEASLRR
jgi:hypothetical protein